MSRSVAAGCRRIGRYIGRYMVEAVSLHDSGGTGVFRLARSHPRQREVDAVVARVMSRISQVSRLS